MDYNQTLKFIFNQLPMYQRQGSAAYKADLKNSFLFDNYLKNPHKKYKTIHVAGTNGKGSVSHMLASVLQVAGYKVGLYTSPHLKDFRERIKINGQKISKEFIVNFIENNKNFISEIKPSFFEMTVFMAFVFFATQKIDIAIIEVGMGGRLDSTNVINSKVSVITNIGFDHTQFLGNSLQKIATEKAGIIKTNVPIVIGQTQSKTTEVFKQTAKNKNSKIYFADKSYIANYSLITANDLQNIFITDLQKNNQKNYLIDLLGDYQKQNLITVLKTIDILSSDLKITKNNIEQGLQTIVKNTGLMGRWQILGNNPKIICDTGHNFEGISVIVNQIQNTPYKKLHLILGFVNDKNFNKLIDLFPRDAIFYFAKANIPRGLETNIIANYAKKQNLNFKTFKTVNDAFLSAKNNAKFNDLIFVGGSTFIVAEVL